MQKFICFFVAHFFRKIIDVAIFFYIINICLMLHFKVFV